MEIMMKMEDGFAMENTDDHNPLSSFFSVLHCLHEAMQNLKHGGVVVEIVVVRIIIFVIKRKCQ
jgi:hypothetical protein